VFRIAICDDNIAELQDITIVLEKILTLQSIEYSITQYKSGEQLMLSNLDYDIYFLDIQMYKLTGIDVAKKIRQIDEKAVIIFITGLKEYVFQAFDVQAFHYILKPIEEEKLKSILISALSKLDNSDKFIFVQTNKLNTKILAKDILYIESEKRKVKVHLRDSVIEYYYKLSDIEEELTAFNFFRCHKSYLINLKYVESFDNSFVILKNSQKIYLSKHKYKEFSKTFMYYLKDRE
jgi:DNA-binding LytR/AlgR family response regulator